MHFIGCFVVQRRYICRNFSNDGPFKLRSGRYGGVTMYQTDWSLAAVTLRVLNADSPLQNVGDKNAPFNLPLASLEGKPG